MVMLTYDSIAQDSAILQDEYSVCIATLGLLAAGTGTSVPLIHATIKGGTGRYGLDSS